MATEINNPWIHEAQIPGRSVNAPAVRRRPAPPAPVLPAPPPEYSAPIVKATAFSAKVKSGA